MSEALRRVKHEAASLTGVWLGQELGDQAIALAVQRGLQEAPAGQVEDVHQVLVLSWNSSQRPGCIRRASGWPTGASQPCQARRVPRTVSAAWVCVRPAASRAARTSSGVGLEKGPFGPRLGWGAISDFGGDQLASLLKLFSHVGLALVARVYRTCITSTLSIVGLVDAEHGAVGADFELLGHLHLQPLFPRRGGQRRAVHVLNYTRNACNVKNFFPPRNPFYGDATSCPFPPRNPKSQTKRGSDPS